MDMASTIVHLIMKRLVLFVTVRITRFFSSQIGCVFVSCFIDVQVLNALKMIFVWLMV